jgi:hypothetical protein
MMLPSTTSGFMPNYQFNFGDGSREPDRKASTILTFEPRASMPWILRSRRLRGSLTSSGSREKWSVEVTDEARWSRAVAARTPLLAYLRVSTDRQGKSVLGIDAQRSALLLFAEGNRFEIVAEHVRVS